MARARLLAAAVLLDLLAGEPPGAIHPVVWLGNVIAQGVRLLEVDDPRPEDCATPRSSLVAPRWRAAPVGQLAYGALLTAGCVGGCAAVGWAVERAARRWGLPGWVAAAFLLKSTFSLRRLAESAWETERWLREGRLAEARSSLRNLVSRDPSQLGAGLVAAAAIESVAENLSDSFVAPALAFALLGLPGALAYRAVNTLDSMIGYRGDYERLGKAAARLDDLANLLPSRLTALLIVTAAALCGRAGRAWRSAWRDARRTDSPNAGWPMSAMAGALGVELEKVGHYRLNPGAGRPQPGDVGRAVRLAGLAALLAAPALWGVGRLRRQLTVRR